MILNIENIHHKTIHCFKIQNSKFNNVFNTSYSGGGTQLFVIIRYGKPDQVASSS